MIFANFWLKPAIKKILVKPLIHKALIIKNYFVFILSEELKELGDKLLEEPRELVSDLLIKLASDSLDTLS